MPVSSRTKALLALSAALLLTTAGSGDARVIDVTDYGANPRDNEDDTEAIEKAVADARELVRAQRPDGASIVGSGPVLYFPAGVHYLSRQIDLSGFASMRGDSGKSMIRWMDIEQADRPNAEAMFRVHAYTNKIENLKFIGGRTHLLFHNANTNQTMIDINGCEFQHAGDFAIRAIPSGDADHLSTELTIRNCKFIFNYQCLETYADYAAVLDTWVELRQPQMKDGAAFVNRSGHLFFDRMVGVPCADISKAPAEGGRNLDNARWVDNYGSFTAIHTRFGAEGAGIPAVYNFRPFVPKYPWVSNGAHISITSSSVYTGSTRRPMGSVVVLYHLPQSVIIRDNVGPVNNPAFIVADETEVRREVQELLALADGQRNVRFVIRDNITSPEDLAGTVPDLLRPFTNP